MFSDFAEIDGRVTALYTVLFLVIGVVIFNYGTYFGANVLELEGGNIANMILGLGFLLSALPAFIMKAVYEANLAAEKEE
jgi:predicted transporter